MKPLQRAYSLIEVLIAAAVVAIGVSAAAVLVGGLMAQEEANANLLRGINLQEQAVRLWQLGLEENQIFEILPEDCAPGSTPSPGAFAMEFSAVVPQTCVVATTAGPLEMTVEVMTHRITYASLEAPVGQAQPYVTHEVTAVRPSIR
jgi:prepilin-type N-terminal cleavage/methylation domain-containing protein